MYEPVMYSPIPASLPIVWLPNDVNWCPYGQLSGISGSGRTSTSYTTANTAVAFPFYVGEITTIYKIGWQNGTSPAGNSDAGIYDASWNLLVSTGSTLRSGASAPQMIDTVNTVLYPNTLYYCATNHSATNANQITAAHAPVSTIVQVQNLAGVKQMAVGATALPSTFTPANLSTVRAIPLILLATNPTVI